MKCIVRKHVSPCCKRKMGTEIPFTFLYHLSFWKRSSWLEITLVREIPSPTPEMQSPSREGCSRCSTADGTAVWTKTFCQVKHTGELYSGKAAVCRLKLSLGFELKKMDPGCAHIFSLWLNIVMLKCRIMDFIFFLTHIHFYFCVAHRFSPHKREAASLFQWEQH